MGQAERTKSRDNDGRNNDDVLEAIYLLTREVTRLTEALQNDNKKSVLARIDELERTIMASQKELAADLALVLDKQQKTAEEIKAVQEAQAVSLQKIADLEALVASGNAPTQELVDAVAAVKAQAQIVDDLIPDVAAPEQS